MNRFSFATEKAKLKEMNFKQKREYIWEYYKVHIIILIILLIAVGSIINTVFINPPKQNYLYIAWLTQQEGINHTELLENALEPFVEDPERQTVTVASYATTGNDQMDMVLYTRFFGRLQSGDIDIYLLNGETISDLTYDDLASPIRETLGNFPTDPSGFAVPLSGSSILAEIGIRSDDLFLAVPVSAQNIDRIIKILEVLLQ